MSLTRVPPDAAPPLSHFMRVHGTIQFVQSQTSRSPHPQDPLTVQQKPTLGAATPRRALTSANTSSYPAPRRHIR